MTHYPFFPCPIYLYCLLAIYVPVSQWATVCYRMCEYIKMPKKRGTRENVPIFLDVSWWYIPFSTITLCKLDTVVYNYRILISN